MPIILNGTYCDPKTNKPWNHGKIAKWKAYFPKKNLLLVVTLGRAIGRPGCVLQMF